MIQIMLKNRYSDNKQMSATKLSILYDIQKGINQGQTISHIARYLKLKYKEQAVSITTIYSWSNKNLIKYERKTIKTSKKEKNKEKTEYKRRQDFLKGKEYGDFIEYKKENKLKEIVEMDLICGNRESTVYILSLYIVSSQMVLLYKLNNKTPKEVIRVLDSIESKIGLKMFRKLFGVILTDRGSEFLKYTEIEYSKKTLTERTKIFYCDAGNPTQKPLVENVNRIIRKVYAKSTNFNCITQEDLYEVASNVNSLLKLNNKSPNDMFIERYGKTLLNKLSLRTYTAEEVVLKPSSL